MRLLPALLLSSLSLACGCADRDAVLVYTVRDATPPVPLRALQIFELNTEYVSNGPILVAWGHQVAMPAYGSITYVSDVPLPFRLCAVGIGVGSDDILLHAVSSLVEVPPEQMVEVALTLAAVEPGGEVPAPCGPEAEPWPEDI